jgi:hypothetical protein
MFRSLLAKGLVHFSAAIAVGLSAAACSPSDISSAPPPAQMTPSSPDAASGEAPSPFGYLVVPPPPSNTDLPYPSIQDFYGGKTIAFDNSDPVDPQFIAAYDSDEDARAAMHDPSPTLACVAPPTMQGALATGGPPGVSGLPGNFPSPGFEGSGHGGCATWATAVCNRILGDTDPNAPVDQVEWNDIAKKIRQRPDSDLLAPGGTFPPDIAKYYSDKGYCVASKNFSGSDADRKELGDKFVTEHCDVKLMFMDRIPPGANGHIETVTGITAKGIQTNSWGTDAYVLGGSSGGFSHSNPNFAGLWPPNLTDVGVMYVCPCRTFQHFFGLSNSSGSVYMASADGAPGFHRYDIISNTWSTPAQPPTTTHAQLTADSENVYLLGDDNVIYQYNPVRGWSARQTGPGASPSSGVAFFKWAGGFYYAAPGTRSLRRASTGWGAIELPDLASASGTFDATSQLLYVRRYGQLGVMVFDLRQDVVVRNWADSTSVFEPSRAGTSWNGLFFDLTGDGTLQRIDLATGAVADTAIVPQARDAATDVNSSTGDIYIADAHGGTFQVDRAARNELGALAASPATSESTIVYVP